MSQLLLLDVHSTFSKTGKKINIIKFQKVGKKKKIQSSHDCPCVTDLTDGLMLGLDEGPSVGMREIELAI